MYAPQHIREILQAGCNVELMGESYHAPADVLSFIELAKQYNAHLTITGYPYGNIVEFARAGGQHVTIRERYPTP